MAHEVDLGEALTQRVQATVGQAAGRQLHLLKPCQFAQQDEELRSTPGSVACHVSWRRKCIVGLFVLRGG